MTFGLPWALVAAAAAHSVAGSTGDGLDHRSVGPCGLRGAEENLAGAHSRCRRFPSLDGGILLKQSVLAGQGLHGEGRVPCSHRCDKGGIPRESPWRAVCPALNA
jgi:hypothetical protein